MNANSKGETFVNRDSSIPYSVVSNIKSRGSSVAGEAGIGKGADQEKKFSPAAAMRGGARGGRGLISLGD